MIIACWSFWEPQPPQIDCNKSFRSIKKQAFREAQLIASRLSAAKAAEKDARCEASSGNPILPSQLVVHVYPPNPPANAPKVRAQTNHGQLSIAKIYTADVARAAKSMITCRHFIEFKAFVPCTKQSSRTCASTSRPFFDPQSSCSEGSDRHQPCPSGDRREAVPRAADYLSMRKNHLPHGPLHQELY